jgi:hypothetical protein
MIDDTTRDNPDGTKDDEKKDENGSNDSTQ